jgi:hypothetical protein
MSLAALFFLSFLALKLSILPSLSCCLNVYENKNKLNKTSACKVNDEIHYEFTSVSTRSSSSNGSAKQAHESSSVHEGRINLKGVYESHIGIVHRTQISVSFFVFFFPRCLFKLSSCLISVLDRSRGYTANTSLEDSAEKRQVFGGTEAGSGV